MGTIRLPGLLTGIDTNKLIAQLMEVERRTLTVYEDRKSLWEERQEALDTLETKLSNLRSSVRALSDADELKAYTAATSDEDKLTATATNNAFEGSHTVVINQLANAERWVHTAGHEYAEDYVGAGTFVYSYNYKETSITTTATTTLSDLVGLINNDANNPGVTASLLHYNDAYHLVLNADDAGTDYEIKINSGTTEVMKSDSAFTDGGDNATLSTKIMDLDQFTGDMPEEAPYPYITIDGADHFGVDIADPDVNITVTGETTIGHLISEINDVFDGRARAVFENGKIVLTDSEDGASQLSITLTYNANGSGTDLTNLGLSQTTEGLDGQADLSGYTVAHFTLSQAAQDSKIKVDGFPDTSAVSEIQTVTLKTAPDNVPDEGTFKLTYRGETTSDIAWSATAEDIESALEQLSTVNDGDITVSGAIAHGVTFMFANTLGDVDLIMIESALKDGGVDVTASISETTPGSDGYIRRSSNTVDDVISGVALHLHDTTDANGEQITLTRDIESVKDKLSSMILAYNKAVEFIKEKTGYNEVLKTAGILMGDYVVSTIRYKFREPLIEQTAGFIQDIDSFLSPVNIGLEFDKDGILSLNENDFDEAVAEDYEGVLALIGADKTGSSTSDSIEFYGASENYTSAGEYTVKVTYSAGAVDKVYIKLSSEGDSAYREMTINGNVATGNSSFDENGDPVYPENNLQVTIPTTGSSTIYATIRVKQGFTGKIEDFIDRLLKAEVGGLEISQEHAADQIEELDEKIEGEQDRLGDREDRLIAKFARLEKALALLQNQMAALGMITVPT